MLHALIMRDRDNYQSTEQSNAFRSGEDVVGPAGPDVVPLTAYTTVHEPDYSYNMDSMRNGDYD